MLDIKQKKAIENLEKAFKKCNELGLYFYGYDTDLCWSLDTEEDREDCACNWLNDAMHEGKAGNVYTNYSYKGSGGF